MDFKTELFDIINYYVASAVNHNVILRTEQEGAAAARIAYGEMTALNAMFEQMVDEVIAKYYGEVEDESKVHGEE